MIIYRAKAGQGEFKLNPLYKIKSNKKNSFCSFVSVILNTFLKMPGKRKGIAAIKN